MKPAPGTTARTEYDADHGTFDSKPVAGRDEVAALWRCPFCDDYSKICAGCEHSVTPHSYCPHVEHYCSRLGKFISCEVVE